MRRDLKKVISRMVAEARVYLYNDVGSMTDYRLVNECAELELDASEVEILRRGTISSRSEYWSGRELLKKGHPLSGLTKA